MKKYTLIIALCFASCDFTKQTPATNPFKPDFEYVAHSYEDTRAFYGKEVLQKVAAAAPEVLKTMNKALPNAKDAFVQVPLNKVQKADIAPYYAIEEENGERSYYQWHLEADGEKVATKLDATTTYLALDIDQFHVEENEEGQEVYPLTFEAIPMEQSNKQAAVNLTLQEDGTITGLDSGDNLVFLTGTSVQVTDVSDTANIDKVLNSPFQLGLVSLMLEDNAEGSYSAEIYLEQTEVDNFHYYKDPNISTPISTNQSTKAGYLRSSNSYFGGMPDVTKAKTLYHFGNLSYKGQHYGYYPLISLSDKPQKVAMTEDDERGSEFVSHSWDKYDNWDYIKGIREEKVQTYQMNPNIPEYQRWKEMVLGFTTRYKRIGNLDDIVPYSGMVDITEKNAMELTGYGTGSFDAKKLNFKATYQVFRRLD